MAKFFTPTKLSENIKETPEGFLLCLGVPIARTGWQEYGPGETPIETGDDGKVWIHRDKEEVLRPLTIASFNAKSVTIKHPDDFVKPENWKELTVGIAQNIRKADEEDEDGELMILADLLITDEIAINLVKNGLREVSCGYDAEYEETGEGEGKQFNIIGNHIALVEQGRAGSAYAIKDHKGKVNNMGWKELAEKLKGLGKTVDEAVAAETKKAEALKNKKAAKTVDDGESTPEQVTYDDIVKHIQDLGAKIESAMQPKKSDDADKEKPVMEEDAEEGEEANEGSRLDKLEAAVAQILKRLDPKQAGDEDEEEMEDDKEDGEEEYMSGDADEEESESEDDMGESCDEEGEEGEESQKKTGDAARFEILTPGKKFKGKDARTQCLKVFAKTESGAKVLKQLGLAKPVFDAKTNTDMLFLAATALVKTKRGVGLNGTKDGSNFESKDGGETQPMTVEKMNEINAKHYGVAK